MSRTTNHLTKDDVLGIVERDAIKFVEIQFCDILGTIKSVTLPTAKLERAITEGIFFDGSSITGYATIEESDMRLMPILDSILIFPWTKRTDFSTCRMMCNVLTDKGDRFEGDPRYILEKVIKKAEDKGFTMNVGPELEFFLFDIDENGCAKLYTTDPGGYFDLMPLDQGEAVRKDVMTQLVEMGFDVDASHHEVAPGQHEVGIRFGDAFSVADRTMTIKYVIKSIALQYGLHATFMPKPLYKENGSGMHVNQSLISINGGNAFHDPDGKHQLSDTAISYIGGLLKYAPEFCAITNSQVNSYKRLVPGFEAPCYISWANKNRSALIRVPAGREMATRVELRSPDPAGNPYLQFAVMLAAGLKGMEDGIDPGAPIEEDIFAMSPDTRNAKGIGSLPENLGVAIATMAKSTLIRETLGDHTFDSYLYVKQKEWDSYRTQITPWEIKNCLQLL